MSIEEATAEFHQLYFNQQRITAIAHNEQDTIFVYTKVKVKRAGRFPEWFAGFRVKAVFVGEIAPLGKTQ